MCRLGMEFEFTGITRKEAAECIVGVLNTSIEVVEKKHLDVPYNSYRMIDRGGNTWRLLRDRSIKPQVLKGFEPCDLSEDAYDYCVELVTPVLDSESLGVLWEILDALRGSGAFANSSCGVHVHVDKPSIPDCCMLLSKFISQQEFIKAKFNINDMRLQKYCKLYDRGLFVPVFLDYNEFISYLYEACQGGTGDMRDLRYHALNFYSIQEHGTVEFRLFEGSLDKLVVSDILDFVVSFCDIKREVLAV